MGSAPIFDSLETASSLVVDYPSFKLKRYLSTTNQLNTSKRYRLRG
jgi:hypothetical protein